MVEGFRDYTLYDHYKRIISFNFQEFIFQCQRPDKKALYSCCEYFTLNRKRTNGIKRGHLKFFKNTFQEHSLPQMHKGLKKLSSITNLTTIARD